jgi:hypothetical protein
MSGPLHSRFKGPRVPKKVQFTQEQVEYNVFLFEDPLKGSKSLKIFKINLTFHFDKLSHLSKSVHIEENSQILTVSNKKLKKKESVSYRRTIEVKLLYYRKIRIQGDSKRTHQLLAVVLNTGRRI